MQVLGTPATALLSAHLLQATLVSCHPLSCPSEAICHDVPNAPCCILFLDVKCSQAGAELDHGDDCRPRPPSDTVVRQLDETYSCYGSRQTLSSLSGCVLCLMRTAHARFPSDSTHCTMVTSKAACRRTEPDIDRCL